MDATIFWRACAVLGIVGLIIVIVAWNSYFTPVQVYSRSIEILFFISPLLCLVKGVFHANRYIMVITSMVSFAYVLMGVWYILSIDEILYGYLLLFFSVVLFLGSLMYVWFIDKRDKLTV